VKLWISVNMVSHYEQSHAVSGHDPGKHHYQTYRRLQDRNEKAKVCTAYIKTMDASYIELA
jgi:hypothetical protein